ncbi:MAG: heme ABC exporter ATP-binding protein CcmA [Pseudooceanicola sp.]|jgi:heme exporter protein A|nr:heme ABC exporter ATP-binding protein CcmA [Pseudooceanicola sp.]
MMLGLHDLSVARGGRPVLSGLSLALAPGQALILRGPNGVGKTTLLRTIAGLQPPFAGQVDCAPETVAYAAHSDGLKPTLTVAENLRFWAAVFGTRDINPALAAYDLAPLAERPAGMLSAGQKRRLGLARLMVTNRPLWALDEPTVSLDTTAVAQFASVLRDHLWQGGAALIATHIDLGITADTLDLGPYRAAPDRGDAFDDAFEDWA